MVTARAVTLKDSMKGENRMVRKGFKMFLNPGMAEEYEKRHNELWPEMKEMIHQYGGHNYSIFWTGKPMCSMGIWRWRTRSSGPNQQIRP